MSITPEKIEKWKVNKKISKLIHALDSEKGTNRNLAAEALGTFTDESAVEALLFSLSDAEKTFRITIIGALGEIGNNRALEPLIGFLGDDDIDIRLRAVESLGRIGDENASDALVKLLRDENERVQLASAHALDSLRWRVSQDENGALYCIIKGEFEKCASLGADAVNPLIQVLLNENRKRYEDAAKALGDIGGPAVNQLTDALRSESGFVSGAAKTALIHMGGPAVDTLVDIAGDDGDIARQLAIEILGEIGDQRAVGPLEKLIQTKDDTIRFWVSESLNKLGWKPKDSKNIQYYIEKRKFDKCVEFGAVAVEPLIQCLKEEDTDVRRQAAEALGKMNDSRAINPLLKLLRFENLYKTAAAALERLGWQPTTDETGARFYMAKGEYGKCVKLGAHALQPLIQALDYEDSKVRLAAVKCLRDIGDKSASDKLIACLEDTDTEFRHLAAEALGKIGDTRAIEPLKIYLARESVFKNQEAITALDKLGWKPTPDKTGARYYVAKREFEKCVALGIEAVEPLIQALWHGDKAVQTAAIEALGKIKDERSVKPLVMLLKAKDENARNAAMTAIVQIGEPAVDELYSLILTEKSKTDRNRLFQTLGEIVDAREVEALKIVVRMADDVSAESPSARLTEKLVELGNDSVRPLLKMVDVTDLRDLAINCLEQIGSPVLDDVFRKILKNEYYDIDSRIHAASFLIEKESKASLTLLLRTLTDKKREVQESGIGALSYLIERKKVDFNRLLPELTKIALTSKYASVAEKATEAMVKMESKEIIPALSRIIRNKREVEVFFEEYDWDYDFVSMLSRIEENITQRLRAIEALEKTNDSEANNALNEVLRRILTDKSENMDIRIRAARTLIDVETGESLKLLFAALENEDTRIQKSGVDALRYFIKEERVDINAVLPELSGLASESEIRDIADLATDAIIHMKSEVIIPVLKNIAENKRKLKKLEPKNQWDDDTYPWVDNVYQRQMAIDALKAMGTVESLKALKDLKK